MLEAGQTQGRFANLPLRMSSVRNNRFLESDDGHRKAAATTSIDPSPVLRLRPSGLVLHHRVHESTPLPIRRSCRWRGEPCPYGSTVMSCWHDLVNHHPRGQSHGLPEIVRAFKTFLSRRINEARATPGESDWQRNYYERVIRDEAEMDRARRYIVGNPANWSRDTENPDTLRPSGHDDRR